MQNWSKYSIEQIVGGKSSDGRSLLELFLKDYSTLTTTPLESLNPSCNTCLKKYFREFNLKTNTMQNDCEYELQPRFHGLPLEFGSAIHLTNANLTNEYAERVIGRYIDDAEARGEEFHPSKLFAKFPEDWEERIFDFVDPGENPPTQNPLKETEQPKEDKDLTLKELRKKYPDIQAKDKREILRKLDKLNKNK